MRSTLPVQAMLATVRSILFRRWPEAVVGDLRSLEARRSDEAAEVRAGSAILSLFALAALCLAAVGVHGTTAFAITARSRELAIRQALGATSGRASRWLLARILRPVGIGLLSAGFLGLAAWRAAATLRGEWPQLPVSLWSAALLVTALVAGLATLHGLVRVRRLEAASALREE